MVTPPCGPTIGALLQMLAPLSARLVKDVVSCFTAPRRAFAFVRAENRSNHACYLMPPRPIKYSDFTKGCAQETENTCKYQSERCHFCTWGPTSRSDIWLRGRGGTLAPWWRHLESTKPPFVLGFWETCWMYGHMTAASASNIYSTQSEEASITSITLPAGLQ